MDNRLRNWYLARLRKLALQDEVAMATPNTLVGADTERIKQIIEKGQVSVVQPTGFSCDWSNIFIGLALTVLFVALVWLI